LKFPQCSPQAKGSLAMWAFERERLCITALDEYWGRIFKDRNANSECLPLHHLSDQPLYLARAVYFQISDFQML